MVCLAFTLLLGCATQKEWVETKCVCDGPAIIIVSSSETTNIADIKATVLFDYDSDVIKDSEMDKIKGIAGQMIDCIDTVIAVGGYASKEGTDEYNQDLSNRRANSVKTALVNLGVDADRIINNSGFGETDIFDTLNLSPNRRVVIETVE